MQLDLKQPTLVLAGTWNPAIFQDAWIAQHLLGIPEGEQVAVTHFKEIDHGTWRPRRVVRFIGDVGFNVNHERLEIFARSSDPEVFRHCENACSKLSEKLLHTPVGALGVNFNFVINDMPDHVADLLGSKDRLDEKYKIISEAHTSTIELDDCDLNLTWRTGTERCSFNFNFHYDKFSSFADVQNLIDDKIQNNLQRAKDLLSSVYSLELKETVSYQQTNE